MNERAHSLGDKVDAAHRCGDLIEKRKVLMQLWADYCGAAPAVPTAHNRADPATSPDHVTPSPIPRRCQCHAARTATVRNRPKAAVRPCCGPVGVERAYNWNYVKSGEVPALRHTRTPFRR